MNNMSTYLNTTSSSLFMLFYLQSSIIPNTSLKIERSYIPRSDPQLSVISRLTLLSGPVRPSCVAAPLLRTLACRLATHGVGLESFSIAGQAIRGSLVSLPV